MGNKKVLQIVGTALTVAGLAINVVTNLINEKVTSIDMQETIKEEVAKQLKEIV
jgi:hypothetical protein